MEKLRLEIKELEIERQRVNRELEKINKKHAYLKMILIEKLYHVKVGSTVKDPDGNEYRVNGIDYVSVFASSEDKKPWVYVDYCDANKPSGIKCLKDNWEPVII